MNIIRRTIVLTVGVTLIGLGCATTMIAAIGVGPWDALNQTISILTRVQVGFISTYLNCLCVIVQLLILRRKFTLLHYMQVPLSIFLGTVINYIYYSVFGGVPFDSIVTSYIMFVLATIVVTFGVAVVMTTNLVTMALEGACTAVGNIINKKMHTLRQFVDVICVIVVFITAYVLDITLVMGVGTIVSAIIFGPLIGFFMNLIAPTFEALGLTPQKKELN